MKNGLLQEARLGYLQCPFESLDLKLNLVPGLDWDQIRYQMKEVLFVVCRPLISLREPS